MFTGVMLATTQVGDICHFTETTGPEMIIKTSDERSHDVSALEALRLRSDLSGAQRKDVEKELIALRSGLKGEREAAYQIDFYCDSSDNYAVIHDLRIEHNGQVAQIDHLVIGRFLTGFVCETKYWSNGISINEHGEFTAHYGSKRIGIPSPIAQNARHIKVLENLLTTDKVLRPKRLGVKLPFVWKPVTLVSTGATISRPRGEAGDAFSDVIKADQFFDHMQSHFKANTSTLMLGKVISTDTLRKVTQSIANLHTPITMNYAAKFGINPRPAARQTAPPVTEQPAVQPQAAQPKQGSREPKIYNCATCGDIVELKVARFCWFNKLRFNNEIRCRAHQ